MIVVKSTIWRTAITSLLVVLWAMQLPETRASRAPDKSASGETDLLSYLIKLPRLFDLEFRIENEIDLASAPWRLRRGDHPASGDPHFNDADWAAVKVGQTLSSQGYPHIGFYWYRVEFVVPNEWKSSRDFLLDLGRISVFDQVFLNGSEIGHYSNLPPAAPESGSSGRRRKYLVDPSLVHFGQENVLAIRVKAGGGGGMYEGPYAFSSLAHDVSVDFALKGRRQGVSEPRKPGENDLLHFLTPAEHLNEFFHGDPIFIHPEIVGLSRLRDGDDYRVGVRVEDVSGALVCHVSSIVSVGYRRFTNPLLELDLPKEGSFICTFELKDSDGNLVWRDRFPFTRKLRPNRIELPVNQRLGQAMPAWNRAHLIHRDSVGHYGGRLMTAERELDPGLTGGDPRGALTYSSLVDPREADIMIFQTNVAPTPKRSKRTPRGNRYDGYNDLWSLGYISVDQDSPPVAIDVGADWSRRTYGFRYGDGGFLEFTNSGLSPAYRVRTSAPSIDVFRRLSEWGIGQPTHLAFASSGGIAIRTAAEGLRGAEMKKSWVLVWFHGGEGWAGFDMPWLFVLEKRPSRIRTADDSLQFRFSGVAGNLFGMPLFGVRAATPYETEGWRDGLPPEVSAACSFWASSLLRYPDFVERDFAVDFAANALTIQDTFTYSEIKDDWNTEPITNAPLSPTLALSAASGNLDIAFDREVIDPWLATLHGPLLLAHNTDTVRFQIRDIVHYMRQERTVTELPAEDPDYLRESARLERAVRDLIRKEALDEHPWTRTLRRRGVVAGYGADLVSNLILAQPHLSTSLQEQVATLLQDELRGNFLFGGYPDERIKRQLAEPFRERKIIEELVDPLNGIPLAMNARDANRSGLDGVVMESFRLYAIWQIAHTVGAWKDVENHWPLIRKIFNLVPHSHDWAINQSWDFFSGQRVGNGLQEGGVIYAGLLGVGRMARQLGNDDLEEYAAYLAAMQLVSLNAAATGIHYFRRHRPWSSALSEAALVGLEEVETNLKERYIEFNEFSGSSPLIINARNDVQNPYSYVLWGLPDAKRPFHDIWPEANRYFFEKERSLGSRRRPLLNLVAYQQRASREEIHRQYEKSLTAAYRASPYLGYTGHSPELVNTRVFLESLGSVVWKTPAEKY